MSLNLTVIGAGPGGYQAAIRASHLGAKTTLVEAANIGGTCLHQGCIPTKTLLASANIFFTSCRIQKYGFKLDGKIVPDISSIIARKNQIIKTQTQAIEKLLQSNHIKLIRGQAKLLTPSKIKIALNDGGYIIKEYDRLILATGSRPPVLDGFSQDNFYIMNSDDALLLKEIPQSLAIIGGGIIGCELAFIYSYLGSQVTIIEKLNRLLPISSLDYECSNLLLREMKKNKITVFTERIIDEMTKDKEKIKLTLLPSTSLKGEQNLPFFLWVDKIIIATNRIINNDNLGLSNIGITIDKHKSIKVDSYLSITPKIWAIGDLLGSKYRPMLAHVASFEGCTAAETALGIKKKIDYNILPIVAFTFPEIAWVGLTLEQAIQKGISAQVGIFSVRLLGRSHASGEITGLLLLY